MTHKKLRVAVFGGAGVFGSRLCRMAKRDGHKVWVVGRSQTSQLTSNEMNCEFLKLDRAGDLAPLWALSPDVVVDAAGPFHAYGDDPYRLPKACIEEGIHYLDLSDNTAFCLGISTLNDAARAAGVVVASGVSSVPALSSAVVADLVQDMQPHQVDIAILPGNQTPRGTAVTESIMAQAGIDFQISLGCETAPVRNWSGVKYFTLPKGVRRKARRFNLPDVSLFPDHFNMPTVVLWAGLELRILSEGLLFYAWARRRLGVPYYRWMATVAVWFSDKLLSRGTNVGGMTIELLGTTDQGWVRRHWGLLVEKGEGPFIPSVAVRAALRTLYTIKPGAGPALNLVDTATCIAAMDDLAVTVEHREVEVTPAFPYVLGEAFADLPPTVQNSHQTVGTHHFYGRAKVSRGTSIWSRLIGWAFRFPKAAEDIEVKVTKTAQNGGEVWERRFAGQSFKSELTYKNEAMSERFGPFKFRLNLNVKDAELHFPVASGAVLGVPLPKALLPGSIAKEYELDGKFHFDVQLLAPITGQLIVRYQGWLDKRS